MKTWLRQHPALALFIASALLFRLFPGVDLMVSGWFYAPGEGFIYADNVLVQLSYQVFAKLHFIVALLLFWSLFAFSAVIFLLPYQGMLLTFIKMRKVDGDHPRPYKVPGGLVVARLTAWTCFTVLALSVVLFTYTPGEGMQWPVLIGVLITLAIGEFVIRFSENHRGR